jgi:hypothetical protein
VPKATSRLICRYTTHDWWALAYPPARRWECRRCGKIVEEAPSKVPVRVKLPILRGRRNQIGG